MKRAVATLFAVSLLVAIGGLVPVSADPEARTFKSSPYEFEISKPDGIDWEWAKVSDDEKKQGAVVKLETIWADAEPPSRASVHVFVTKLSKEFAKKKRSAESIAKIWGENFEQSMENPRNRKAAALKIPAGDGKVDAWSNDVTGNNVTDASLWRLRYVLAKNGEYIYTLMISRNGKLVDDEDLDEELDAIVKSFKFNKVLKPKAHKKGGKKGGKAPGAGGGGSGNADVDPEKVKREKYTFDFWRLDCVKPQGLMRASSKTFIAAEKHYNLVLKLTGTRPQSNLTIRVYVKSLKGKDVFSIDKLVESRVKTFKKRYPEDKRQPPEESRWKDIKGTRKGVKLRLVSRLKGIVEQEIYFLEHKNDRQYTIDIVASGGLRPWKKVVDDFMKNFKPHKK